MNTMKTLILTVACCLMAIAQTQAKDLSVRKVPIT